MPSALTYDRSYFYPARTLADKRNQGNMVMMSELWKNSPVFVNESSSGILLDPSMCAYLCKHSETLLRRILERLNKLGWLS
jgi:hypothetical protein